MEMMLIRAPTKIQPANMQEDRSDGRRERKIITGDDVQFAIQIGRYLFSFDASTQLGVYLPIRLNEGRRYSLALEYGVAKVKLRFDSIGCQNLNRTKSL